MFATDTTIEISLGRYTELVRAEAAANSLKTFLTGKLEKYGRISHSELEVLESMGLIRRAYNVSAE